MKFIKKDGARFTGIIKAESVDEVQIILLKCTTVFAVSQPPQTEEPDADDLNQIITFIGRLADNIIINKDGKYVTEAAFLVRTIKWHNDGTISVSEVKCESFDAVRTNPDVMLLVEANADWLTDDTQTTKCYDELVEKGKIAGVIVNGSESNEA